MSLFRQYLDHGWRLCGINRGSKAPVYDGWQQQGREVPADAIDGFDGAGLLHAWSGTCALDIDDLKKARPWLAERGVDVDSLLKAIDAVMVSSGKPNRAKLLYRLRKPLRTFKPKDSGIELRCATAEGLSVQDVLPPTIHPETLKPYVWKFNDALLDDWRILPPLPTTLLTLWRSLMAEVPTARSQNPSIRGREGPTIAKIKAANDIFIRTTHKDVSNYDDWIEIGQRLHTQTGGAEEGLDVWDDWSATDDSLRRNGQPRYAGRDSLLMHWLTFREEGGRSMDPAFNMLPATAEDFPEEPAPKDDTPAEGAGEPPADSMAAHDNQTAKAKRKAAIAELERKLVYVMTAERYFDTEHHRVINSENGIKHLYTHTMPRGKSGARLDPVKVLMNSSTKTVVSSVAFHPGKPVLFTEGDDSYANRYRNRLPEPLEPTEDEIARIEWIFNRIDDPSYRSWLMQLYAHVVQFPGTKIRSAPLIWSETEGNGKTTLVKSIPALLVEPRYSKEVTYDALNGQFNDYMLEGWHINLTEFTSGSRGERTTIGQKIKWMIAETEINVRGMYSPGVTLPNRCFVTSSSNEGNAAQVGNEDRRWGIHELMAARMTDAEVEYVYDEFLSLPRAAGVLRHYFLNYPITDFNPAAKAIETEAKREMVEASMPADKELLVYAWEQCSAPLDRDIVITSEVTTYVCKNSVTKPSVSRVGKLLTKKPFNGTPTQFRVENRNYRAVILRNFAKWSGATGQAKMAHVVGDDEDLSA